MNRRFGACFHHCNGINIFGGLLPIVPVVFHEKIIPIHYLCHSSPSFMVNNLCIYLLVISLPSARVQRVFFLESHLSSVKPGL